MSELALRTAVAAVAIPVVLGLVYLGGWFLSAPVALFAALGTHELARLAREEGVRPLEWVGAPAAATLVFAASWRPSFSAFAPLALVILGAATVTALVAALWTRSAAEAPLGAVAVTLLGAVYVGLTLAFVPLLHALPSQAGWSPRSGSVAGAGFAAVALPLAVTWVGDAAAYFAGSAWGRAGARLAPSISPNKSWVGFWAALLGGAVAAVTWMYVAISAGVAPPVGQGIFGSLGGVPVLAVAGAAIACAAVLGDLVESLLKREAGVKDSGAFFPGHGGVLDRVDSLLFTIPAAYVILTLLGALP